MSYSAIGVSDGLGDAGSSKAAGEARGLTLGLGVSDGLGLG